LLQHQRVELYPGKEKTAAVADIQNLAYHSVQLLDGKAFILRDQQHLFEPVLGEIAHPGQAQLHLIGRQHFPEAKPKLDKRVRHGNELREGNFDKVTAAGAEILLQPRYCFFYGIGIIYRAADNPAGLFPSGRVDRKIRVPAQLLNAQAAQGA